MICISENGHSRCISRETVSKYGGRWSFPAYSLPGGSPWCVQVCIVFTDGKPSIQWEIDNVPKEAKAWARIGVTVFAVGIGSEITKKGNSGSKDQKIVIEAQRTKKE